PRGGPEMRSVSPGHESTIRFVEADVSVASESKHHQVNATGSRDRTLIALAFSGRILRHPVQEMRSFPRDIHVIQQMPLHECVIALRIARRQADELVQVERARLREIDFL